MSAAPAIGPAVCLRDVRLQLGATPILHGIDWQVRAGEVHALVGANGCGKSSLIKTLLGQMPHRGEVTLHWPGDTPGTLAYVPQAIECDRTLPMTVQDFMACMLQPQPLFWGIRRAVRERIAVTRLDRRQTAARSCSTQITVAPERRQSPSRVSKTAMPA